MADFDPFDPPKWALERAAALCNALRSTTKGWRDSSAGVSRSLNPDLHAFARYIAEHEGPPVDPLRAAMSEVWRRRGWGEPMSEVDDVAAELAKRGLKIVETSNA